MDRVTVPGWVLAVICGGLALSLLALAFLLGRQSGGGGNGNVAQAVSPAPAPSVVAAAPPAVSSQPVVPPTPPAPVTQPATAPADAKVAIPTDPTTPHIPPPVYATPSQGSVQPQTSVVVTQKPGSTSAPVDEAEKAAVVAYFASVDNLHPGSLSGSPEELVNAAATGDLSGIDKMITQAREGERTARSITPPAPCRDVHQQSVKLLGDSIQMLVAIRAALAQGDVGKLQDFSLRATTMKSQAEELERRQNAIRVKYGVPAAPRSSGT